MNSQLIKWNVSYSVGIEIIDKQHKKLIDIINRLFASFNEGKAIKVIPSIIDELTDYTVYHFKTEEELFDKHDYPDSEKHKLSHKKFINQVAEWKTKLSKGDEDVHYECISFLKEWLINHIVGEDKKYTKFMKNISL